MGLVLIGRPDPAAAGGAERLLTSTYLGGSRNDEAFALAISPRTGEVFVTGLTESRDFPGTASSAAPSQTPGSGHAFVARLSADLATLEQTTYFGGSGLDIPYAIAVDPSNGDVVVAGQSSSPDLPETAGAAQAQYGGGYDAFIARFDSTLAHLKQVTYLGGSGADAVSALAIDPRTSDIFAAGYTASADLPSRRGGARETRTGIGYDGFVARLDASLTSLRQTTYVGGERSDEASALAIDPASGDVFVAGQTESTDFPGTAGGAQPGPVGLVKDGFVARLSPDLASLRQSTYLGGRLYTDITALAIHPATGEVYVAGETASEDLPGAPRGAQPRYAGSWDGYVARLNGSLALIESASYFGGSGVDLVHAMAIDAGTGDVYLAGQTNSFDLARSADGALQGYGGGYWDAFLARFDASLGALETATFLGGADIDRAYAVATNSQTGEVFLAGETRSSPFPGTAGGAQPVFGGGDLYGGDAFVLRLPPDPAAGPVRRVLLPVDRARRPPPRAVTFE